MKKLMMMLALTAMLLGLNACGDDKKDEPVEVKAGTYTSVYDNEGAKHYNFDVNTVDKTCTITVYNVQFKIGEQLSPMMTIRIPNARYTTNQNGIIINDTDIDPEMFRGTRFVPMGDDAYVVTDLKSELNTREGTFTIYFKCHGGDFSDSGKFGYYDPSQNHLF
ncbi:MAG: hypothetical protein IKR25_08550 [Muribaculaceae bacterium]|nr:hypothetical protein [Muribaculaceae bacterium]